MWCPYCKQLSIYALMFSKGIMFVIEGGLWSSQMFLLFTSASYLLYQLLEARKGLALSPPLLHPKGPKPEKKKTARQKFWVARLSNLSLSGLFFFSGFSVLVRMASWKFSLSGLFWFFFLSRFWGRRPLRRCDGLPFYSPSKDVVSLYVRSLNKAKGSKTQRTQRCFLFF